MFKKFNLKAGDVFIQSWPGVIHPMKFEVLDIDHQNNKIIVKCKDFQGSTHEETWNDLKTLEAAFDIGEYKLITAEEKAEQRLYSIKNFAKQPYVNNHVSIAEMEFRFDTRMITQCLISREEFERNAKLDIARKLIANLVEEGKINFIIKEESVIGSLGFVDPESFDNSIS